MAPRSAFRASSPRDISDWGCPRLCPTSPNLPSPDWLKRQFERPGLTTADRRALLAGRPVEGACDEGPLVCVCFQVGASRIAEAASGDNCTVAAIGAKLGAGTNCCSCLPEILRILAANEAARERA
jgi:assimilatory nitrate reductase catalytic subunit